MIENDAVVGGGAPETGRRVGNILNEMTNIIALMLILSTINYILL